MGIRGHDTPGEPQGAREVGALSEHSIDSGVIKKALNGRGKLSTALQFIHSLLLWWLCVFGGSTANRRAAAAGGEEW